MGSPRLWIARKLCPRTHAVVPRVPTREMTKAAARAMSPGRRPTSDWVSAAEKHAIRYRAMIEAEEGN